MSKATLARPPIMSVFGEDTAQLMQPEHGGLLVWTGDRGPSATRLDGAQVWAVAS